MASGKTTNLKSHEDKVLNVASSLSPDGKILLITSNKKGGYQNVALLDVATRKLTWVTDAKWEASAGDFSPTGESFTYTINGDGLIDAFLVEAATLHAKKFPVGPGLNSFPVDALTTRTKATALKSGKIRSTRSGELWSGSTSI